MPLQLMNIGPAGRERPVIGEPGGDAFDLTPLTDAIDGPWLAADGPARAVEAAEAGQLPRVEIGGQRVGAPLLTPGALVCVGMNYAAHAAESGGQPPEVPIIFFKTPNTVIGPEDDVIIPKGSEKTDWEVELAVVIGKRASYLDSPDDADACIAGYTISNDVSERAFQLEVSGGQWSKGKCCPTFNPMGPGLVLRDDVADPQGLNLSTTVNGEVRQASTTKDMIFSVRHLVWDLSQYLTLEPGYVINTGTPQGVALSGRFPYLKDGDVMELEIDGLGRQRQTVRAWPGSAAG